jgi:acetoin utilization protein AcuB
MFISKSMTKKLVTISKEINLIDARKSMEKNKIRHLPVVDSNNLLLGMVTDRDIRSAVSSIHSENFDSETEHAKMSSVKVADIMTTELVTVSPLHTLQDVMLLFDQHRFGAIPVIDEKGILVGIISVRDLLRAFINVMGIGEPGILLCILAEQKVGQMKKIVDIITEENISMGSILVARYWEKGKRAVFPYLLTNNVVRVKKKLQEAGYQLLDPWEWYLDQLPHEE